VRRLFQFDFDDTTQYGFIVVLSRNDLKESDLAYRTKLSAPLVAGTSSTISLVDTSGLSQFTPPFLIVIGAEQVQVDAIDGSGNALVSPSYNDGVAVSSHSSGDTAFVTKLLVPVVISGLPVDPDYQSGGDPTAFSYYPPFSGSSYIPLGRGLVGPPATAAQSERIPAVVAVQDLRELVDLPDPALFSPSEISPLVQAANAVKSAVMTPSGMGVPADLLKDLVNWSASEVGGSFPSYWNDRPFVGQSNYLRGEALSGVTRFEFCDEMKSLYRDVFGADLLTTMAIFRGDIFGGMRTFGSAPTGLTVGYSSSGGSLTSGTWAYRVSTITVSGESSPTASVAVMIPASAGTACSDSLSWGAVAGATGYHVYRMGSSANTFYEYRITPDGGVGGTSFVDTGLPGIQTVRRGVWLTGKKVFSACQLQVYVPPVSGGDLNPFFGGVGGAYSDSTPTQNEMVLTVTGILPDGTPDSPLTVDIPIGSARGTKIGVGTSSNLYVGLFDLSVAPGANVNLVGGQIQWSPYDLVVVQNV
jgi:hypothetical protein